MIRRCGSVVVVALFALALPVRAQEATLKWEFVKDKPFQQELTTTTKQTMKVMGMDITQNQEQTFTFSWTPKEKDEKTGSWTVIQKIEAVKMNIEIGGNTITYDSTKDAATNNALGDFFKALVGSEFKLTIDKDMKITKIDGRDDFINKLVKANPTMEPLLKQILGDEALKQMADPAFAAVPSKAVKKGDKWTKESTLNMGPIGSYKIVYNYEYDGKDGKLDKIKVGTDLKYEPPTASAAGSLPFKIKEAKLTTKNAGGEIKFDNEKHRLDSSDMKMTLEGTLKIEINGNPTDVALTQEQTTKVKTSDPAAKK